MSEKHRKKPPMNTASKQEQPEERVNAPSTDSDIHAHLEFSSKQQVTNFVDEVPAERAILAQEPIVEEVNPLPSQSLLDILSRPRIVYNFKWTTNQTTGTRIARLPFPDLLFSSPTIWSKIQQYAFLHANLKFAVRSNGTAYHYGQLLFAWRAACLDRTLNLDATLPNSFDSLYSCSQRPCMLISPSSSQLVELEVPYQSPFDRIPISAFSNALSDSAERRFANMGVLEIWVLTPLRATGDTSDPAVTVNLFASFVNPSLSGYTHQAFTYVPSTIPTVAPLPIPTTLRYTKQITQAKKQPSQTSIVYTPAKIYSSVYDQPTASLCLTETSTERLKPFQLSDALNTWSLFTQFNISGTAANNSLLLAFPVNPTNCMTGTYLTKTITHHTLLSYISTLFNLWRGPIEFRFDFIASKFHSARVKIAWYPPQTSTLAGYSEMGDEWTKVVDVQGQISETFTAPFIQPVSYLPNDSYLGDRMMNGTIVVSLLNAVSYPTSPIPPMSVNVWIRGPNVTFSAFTGLGPNSINLFSGQPPYNGTTFFPSAAISTSDPVDDFVLVEPEQKHVTQAKLDTTLSPVDLQTLIHKPTIYFKIYPNEKFFITPPILETNPANTVNATTGSLHVNSLLDWFATMTLGYIGSVRFSLLNPQASIFVIPRSYRGYNDAREANAYKSNPLQVIEENRWSASAYYPAGVNVLKDYTLPCYSSLVYRPFTLRSGYRVTSFALIQPAVDLYNFGPEASHVLVAAGDDFSFFGLAAAPVTF